jgi:3-oxoacyl-[acyl-carrier-protein] synthase-3
MNGREVYKRAVEEMSRSVQDILAAGGHSIGDVDLLVAHQANARILEAVAARLGIERDRVALNIVHRGNTSAASIPLAIHDAMAEGRLSPGDRVVLTAFGAGFVWGAGLMTWGIANETAGAASTREAVHV